MKLVFAGLVLLLTACTPSAASTTAPTPAPSATFTITLPATATPSAMQLQDAARLKLAPYGKLGNDAAGHPTISYDLAAAIKGGITLDAIHQAGFTDAQIQAEQDAAKLAARVATARKHWADHWKELKDQDGKSLTTPAPDLLATSFMSDVYVYLDSAGKPQGVVEIVDPSGRIPDAWVSVGITTTTPPAG